MLSGHKDHDQAQGAIDGKEDSFPFQQTAVGLREFKGEHREFAYQESGQDDGQYRNEQRDGI